MGEPSLDDSNVKVAVRVRPMNRRGESASAPRPGYVCGSTHPTRETSQTLVRWSWPSHGTSCRSVRSECRKLW